MSPQETDCHSSHFFSLPHTSLCGSYPSSTIFPEMQLKIRIVLLSFKAFFFSSFWILLFCRRPKEDDWTVLLLSRVVCDVYEGSVEGDDLNSLAWIVDQFQWHCSLFPPPDWGVEEQTKWDLYLTKTTKAKKKFNKTGSPSQLPQQERGRSEKQELSVAIWERRRRRRKMAIFS